MPDRSPVQFNAYLSAIERDLPQQDDKALAMTFYSKLTKELKKQFKTSDILILETRAKCVVVAQRIWEGLHGSDERKSFEDYKGSKRSSKERDYKNSKEKDDSRSKYPSINLRRDQKDCYRLGH